MKVIVKKPNEPMEIQEWDMNPYVMINFNELMERKEKIIGTSGIDHFSFNKELTLYFDDIGALREDHQYNFTLGNDPVFQPVVVLRFANVGYEDEMLVDVSEDDITFCRSFMEK